MLQWSMLRTSDTGAWWVRQCKLCCQSFCSQRLQAATLQLAPLLAPQKAAERVAAAATASEIKRMVDELPMLLSNRSKGLQGEISRHQAEVKQERYVKSMPTSTAEQKTRKRTFVSGASKEGEAALHVSRTQSIE